QLNRKSLRYQYHDPETTIIEGVLARGDRRLSKVIEGVYRRGCLFESWTEHFDYQVWDEEITRQGLTIDFYNRRERGSDEIFPWDLIDIGVTKGFLMNEWE
ncbi:B12-binding domain-containing radical SAM protein, partial [Dysgonomonas sp. 25]